MFVIFVATIVIMIKICHRRGRRSHQHPLTHLQLLVIIIRTIIAVTIIMIAVTMTIISGPIFCTLT